MNWNSPDRLPQIHAQANTALPVLQFACTEASVSYRYISRLKSLQVKFPLGLGGEKSHHSFAPSRTPRWLQFKVEAFPQNIENDQETT